MCSVAARYLSSEESRDDSMCQYPQFSFRYGAIVISLNVMLLMDTELHGGATNTSNG